MIELLLSSAKGERHFEDFLCEQNILTIEPESVSITFARAGLTSEREIAGFDSWARTSTQGRS